MGDMEHMIRDCLVFTLMADWPVDFLYLICYSHLQSLMDHDMTTAESLRQSYADKCQNAQEIPSLMEPTIIMGLRLGKYQEIQV